MIPQTEILPLTPAQWIGRLVWIAAAAGLVGATLWTLSTLILAKPVLPFAGVLAFFVGVFPVHLRTIAGLRRLNARWSRHFGAMYRLARAYLEPRELIVIVALFLGYGLMASSALADLGPGQPEIHGGRYYADNHGILTRISAGEFHHLQLMTQRLFTAVPAAFYLIAVAYGLGAERRRRAVVAPDRTGR